MCCYRKVWKNKSQFFNCNFTSNKSLNFHLLDELDCNFSVLGVTETKITSTTSLDFNPKLLYRVKVLEFTSVAA